MPSLDEVLGARTSAGANAAVGVQVLSEMGTITFDKYVRVVLPSDGYVFWVRAALLSPAALLGAFPLNAAPFNQGGKFVRAAGGNVPILASSGEEQDIDASDGSPIQVAPGANLQSVPADSPIEVSPGQPMFSSSGGGTGARAVPQDPNTLTLTVQGSFHWDTMKRQEEGQNYAASTAVFTALSEVNALKAVAPGTAWIARRDRMTFAFSSQGYFYRTTDLFHYRGVAVFSDLLTQVVDNMGQVNIGEQVVSNSLPLWLSFNGYKTFYGIQEAGLPVYPSFLVPDNLAPPYAAVHVIPETTLAIASAPRLSRRLAHDQLTEERVRVTFSGARNGSALDFMDFVNQYTLDTDNFGIMGIPIIRDEGSKRTQSELNIMAQRKTAEFHICYCQHRVRDIAQQLITKSIPSFTFI